MVLVWKPITDLSEDWSSLTDGELVPLLQFWNDQRTDLEQSGALAVFNQRLAREWSIETGQIEGVYNLDRGTTETLIEKGISADLIPRQPGQKPPELIAAIIQDHADVLEGLFQFLKGERPLSKSYIHELHAALLKHQDTTVARDQFGQIFETRLVKGKYKERPNNPQRADGTVYEFCPPEQVEPEMERLLAMHGEHEKGRIPVEVEAAWLHHRFTQIHPYQDGNGRVARALASLLLIKAGWFPMVVTRDDRPRYLDALELGDAGDMSSLISFLIDIQKRALYHAVQTAGDIQVPTVEGAIAAAKKVLTGPAGNLDSRVWVKAETTADRLMDIAGRRLEEIVVSLAEEIGRGHPEFEFTTTTKPFVSVAGYVVPPPNTLDYVRARGLRMVTRRPARIEVNAHGVGSKFRGLIRIATIFAADPSLENAAPKQIASREPFQVNYAESYESAARRFRPWLEESLVNALTLWRRNL
jgi:fido (protein-threonine AMPylation protein)